MTAPVLAVIGASWGGFQAVGDLIGALHERCALAVAVAQHRAADSPADAYVRAIQARSRLPVAEAEDKVPIEPGRVYVAPADYHLLVDDGRFGLTLEGPVRFSRPSIDVLFESAAEAYGDRVVGVVLTGANDDGCRGALAIKEAGGRVYAQDPETAERREMPDGVIGSGAVDAVLAVPAIAILLNELGGVHRVTERKEPALLLVDDVEENLLAVEAVLQPLGHRMLRASSGEEALRHLLTDEIGVIVLDVQMPGLDGFETAHHIKDRDRTRDIPIVFLTALGGEIEHRLRGYAAGAVDYLAKPVDPDILRAKVRVFLELHLATQELREQGEELARRTRELERSNADLEQFSYVASHDLQEPLRVIAGYLELLTDHLADQLDDDARTWIDRAGESAGRMSSMIQDLLTYARAGTGGGEPEDVDLDDAIARAVDAVGASIRESGGQVQHEPGLGRVRAVRLDVERVLQNLLANAIKYRGERAPTVVVTARRHGGEVTVSVCDDGRGVPAEDLDRVFGRFEHVAGEPYPGTGLGLAVCRRLIEHAGGRIWMTRNTPSAGVTVQFTLPATS